MRALASTLLGGHRVTVRLLRVVVGAIACVVLVLSGGSTFASMVDQFAVSAAVKRADLAVTSVSGSVKNGRVVGKVSVKNRGKANAKASQVDVKWLPSSGGRLRSLGRLQVPALKPGKTVVVSFSFKVPKGLDGKRIWLQACADSKRGVREASEANNCRQMGGTVKVPAPTTGGAGDPPPSTTPTTPPTNPPPTTPEVLPTTPEVLPTTPEIPPMAPPPLIPEVDTTPPDTAIGSKPATLVNAKTASIGFSSNETGSSFECRLDNSAWRACTTPDALTNLADGAHTFEVRATDSAGNTDASPAKAEWTVDTVAPTTSITSGPAGDTPAGPVSFGFSSSEAGSTFQCKLDTAAFASCTSPHAINNPSTGAHTFTVRATDAAGNTETTGPSTSWATRPTTTNPPPDVEGVSYTVPSDTVMYGPGDIASVTPGAASGQGTLVLPAAVTAPKVDGHMVVSRTPTLPDGLVAHVLAVVTNHDGSRTVTVEQAPLDAALDDVRITFDQAVAPEILDETGAPVPGAQRLDDGSVALSFSADAGSDGRGNPSLGDFECKDADGESVAPQDLLRPTSSLPVTITVGEVSGKGDITPGGRFALRLSGPVTGKLAFEARAAFHCELSERFIRRTTLKYTFVPGGPVPPVNFKMQPAFELDVTASGEVSVSQTHHFALDVEKQTGAIPTATLTDTREPPDASAAGHFDGRLFVGATAAVSVGGRYFGLDLEAGLKGTFGPEVAVKATPACVSADVSLKGTVTLFLDVFSEYWERELATASAGPYSLVDTCGSSPSAPTWSEPVDVGKMIDLACPSESQCTGVGIDDGVVITFNPSIPSAIHRFVVAPGSPTRAIDCPSTVVCTLLDGWGNVFTFNPREPREVVPTPTIPSDRVGALASIACPDLRQCTTLNWRGGTATFDPGAPGTTSPAVVSDVNGKDISCPSTRQCTVAVGGLAQAVTFDPLSPATSRRVAATPNDGYYFTAWGLDCPSPRRCVLVSNVQMVTGSDLGAYASFDPTTDTTLPMTVLDTFGVFQDVTCGTPSSCVIFGGPRAEGRVHVGSATSDTWDDPVRISDASIAVGHCASERMCALVDSAGNLVVGRTG